MQTNRNGKRQISQRSKLFETLEPRRVLAANLVISEFVADNDGSLLDQNDRESDWIEIHNSGDSVATLNGLYLTDDQDGLAKWQFPNVDLEAGAYLVVFASGDDLRDSAEPLHTNFKLNSDGEYLALVDSDGESIIDELTFDAQVSGVSYGVGQVSNTSNLIARGSPVEYLIPTFAEANLGKEWTSPSFDSTPWTEGIMELGFELEPQLQSAIAYENAVGSIGTQSFGGALGMDFVVHTAITVTDLGVFDSGADGLSRTITAQMWSRDGNSGRLLAEQEFSRTSPGDLVASDRLKPLAEPIVLQPGDYTIVAHGYGSGEPNGNAGTGGPDESQKVLDDGNGAISFVGGSRFGSNAGRFPSTADGGPENRYSAGTFRYTAEAIDAVFGTDIEEEMHGVNSSVYVRIPFDVSDLESIDRLRLNVNYDDGFVAYLNGVELAQRNAPDVVTWASSATESRPSDAMRDRETIDITNQLTALQFGENVLALQGLNAAAHDSDFLLDVELESIDQIGDRTLGYFLNPTPGDINTAIDYTGLTGNAEFSQERGFFVTPFDLNIVSATEDAMLVYTVDGSEPTVGQDGAISNGALFSESIRIDKTTTIRALSWHPQFLPSEIVTQSYLFLDQVVNQNNAPDGYPDRWRSTAADYAMENNAEDLATIAGNADLNVEQSKDIIKESLLAIPTLSIVMDAEDLFDSRTGIYSNPSQRGDAWERATSVEYLLPDGEAGFQINAGIQIMGGTSRDLNRNMKQSFRLVFKNEYGRGRLNYQFFPDNPVDSFNTLTLRTNSRDNWSSSQYTNTATYLRDQWAKETMSAMRQPATSGLFVHLYINGMYWGIYNPTERPDASFLASHTDVIEEDVDTVKFCCPQRVVDGDWREWNELRSISAAGLEDAASYQQIQGNNPDGTRNPDYDVLIDIDNFIDYVIQGQFTGSEDWPGNYYVARDSSPDSEGFKFFTWDNDLAFRREDKATPDRGHNWWTESPGEMDIALRANAEYRLRFADRVQQHYFNDGALTSKAAVDRWNSLVESMRKPLIAESARWGDNRGRLYTPHDQWDRTVASVATYLDMRPNVVLDQLREHGLYPEIDAPTFSQHGGLISSGFQLNMDAVLGTVFNETRLIAEGGPVSAWVPTSLEHDAGESPVWTLSNFDTSAWIHGTGGVGYEQGSDYDPFLGIDLLDPNLPIGQGIDADRDGARDNTSVYMRFDFDVVSDLSNAEALILRVRYDDGFIAYMNGTEVLRVNAPNNAGWDSQATTSHEAEGLEDFDITEHLSRLLPGRTNVLAIHGLNRSRSNNDLLFSPELVVGTDAQTDRAPIYFTTDGTDPRLAGGEINRASAMSYDNSLSLNDSTQVKARALVNGTWSALTGATFFLPNIVVTEVNYNPGVPSNEERIAGFTDNDDFEFIELQNIGATEINLEGFNFSDVLLDGDVQGIEFDFSNGNIKSLMPGQRLVVVSDSEAFSFRYGDGIPVAGQFSGQLSNGGETITLQFRDQIVQQFAYVDDWHASTDGDGKTLEIINQLGDLSLWNQQTAWRPSESLGGTPGKDRTPTNIPGDSNHDGIFDSSDLVLVFTVGEYEDDVQFNSNYDEGDWNGDGEFDSQDLVFAFQAGTFTRTARPVGIASASDFVFEEMQTTKRRSPIVP